MDVSSHMMNAVYILLINCFVLSNAVRGLSKREDDANNTLEYKARFKLEMFRDLMAEGDPKLGLPILDPFVIENYELSHQSPFISLNLNLEHISIVGLKEFYINNLTIYLLPTQIDFSITIPNVKVTVERYTLKGRALRFIPLRGKGIMEANVRGLTINGFIQISLRETNLRITDASLCGEFADFTYSITGLMRSKLISKLASVLVTKFVPLVLREHRENVCVATGNVVKTVGNEYIHNLTFQDLLAILEDEQELIPDDVFQKVKK